MTRETVGDRTDARSVVTTGTFDGVPTVVTFSPHPREVILGHPIPLLTTLDERADALEALGVERFVVVPFSRDLSMLEPETYVADVLADGVGMQEIVIGYDHRFGRKARGDRALLEALGERHGFTVDVIPEQIDDGVTVSSTEIRRLLADGAARRAADLLGRPYRLTGTVIRGNQRGRTIGYPTANVAVADTKLVPATGVYAVRITTADGVERTGMMNIGRRPTVEVGGAVTVEVHVFDFAADVYGTTVQVDVVGRLRDERKFDGLDALKGQLDEDVRDARSALD